MSHYLDQIKQLIALQKVDNAIYDVNKLLNKAPEEIEALKQKFEDFDNQKLHIEEKIVHLHEQEKRVQNEVEESVASIKKSKAKLTQVENEREFNAVSREMDSMEKQNKTREDEQSALSGELSFQNAKLEEVIELWEEAEKMLQTAQENFAQMAKESEGQLAELEVARNVSLGYVPAPVLSRYEFIRRRLKHPVIVPVIEGVCTGCHISIPPQAYNELQRGQQIVSCPNCQRLIYWSEHFTPVEEIDSEGGFAPESSLEVEETTEE